MTAVQHGTLTGYIQHRCRCPRCRQRHSSWMRAYRRRRILHGPVLVQAGPAKQHVQELLVQGMSFRAIALAAGWRSRNSLAGVMRAERIHPETAARILAVREDRRHQRYVTALGAARRLQALAVMGWRCEDLAAVSGGRVSKWTLREIRGHQVTQIRFATDVVVIELYERLWNRTGPSAATTGRARRLGWLAPMDLDDDHMYDDVMRDDPAPSCAICDEFDFLRSWGQTLPVIAARLGLQPASLDTHLRRHRGRRVA